MERVIRVAKPTDITEILEIINFEIKNSTSIYDYHAKSYDEMMQWFDKKKKDGFPVVVVTDDEKILGYGTFGIFRPWDGYQFSLEHSIYIHNEFRGLGLGGNIMKALIKSAKEQGYHCMIAGVDATNIHSVKFHKKHGFHEVGKFEQIGYKFGKWLDLVFMQLFLNEI